jgi:hypothetical protein
VTLVDKIPLFWYFLKKNFAAVYASDNEESFDSNIGGSFSYTPHWRSLAKESLGGQFKVSITKKAKRYQHKKECCHNPGWIADCVADGKGSQAQKKDKLKREVKKIARVRDISKGWYPSAKGSPAGFG